MVLGQNLSFPDMQLHRTSPDRPFVSRNLGAWRHRTGQDRSTTRARKVEWYAPQRNEARAADRVVHVARRHAGHRPDPRRDRPEGRRGRLRFALGDGPFLADPERRAGRGADARGLDDARVHGGADQAGAPRADGRRHPLPEPRACGSRPRRRSTCCRAGAPGSASGPPGTRPSPRVSASPSRRSASGSRCSRRRSRSRTGCGRASWAARGSSTGGCSMPGVFSTPRSRCHAPGCRS